MRNLIFLGLVLLFSCSTTTEKEAFVRDPNYRCSSAENCSELITNVVTNTFSKKFEDANEYRKLCNKNPDSTGAEVTIFINRAGFIESMKPKENNIVTEFSERAIEAVYESAPYFEFRDLSDEVFAEAEEIIFLFVCEPPPLLMGK